MSVLCTAPGSPDTDHPYAATLRAYHASRVAVAMARFSATIALTWTQLRKEPQVQLKDVTSS